MGLVMLRRSMLSMLVAAACSGTTADSTGPTPPLEPPSQQRPTDVLPPPDPSPRPDPGPQPPTDPPYSEPDPVVLPDADAAPADPPWSPDDVEPEVDAVEDQPDLSPDWPDPDVDEPDAPCCRRCAKGKPCGDTCIDRDKSCRSPPGCACWADAE